MIQELLVLIACTQNQGCNQTTNIYYKNNPAIEQVIKRKEKIAMSYLAPSIIEVAPYALIMVTSKGSFRINSYLDLQIHHKEQMGMVLYHFDF